VNIEISYAQLTNQRFLRVRGADADAFLQALLAVDITGLPGNGARLAPWLSAKGRVTALFSLARLEPGDWLLATDSSQAQTLAKRLQLFVLRSAVEVLPADQAWQARVVYLGDEPGPLPTAADDQNWTATDSLLGRRTAPGCLEVWGPIAALEQLTADLPKAAAGLTYWHYQWVANGWPRITAGEQDRFTAHMLNLDLLDAVSFTKGCYPGQEVVARTQNLGRPKRRTLLFSCASALPEPGQALVDEQGRSWGQILNSAAGSPHLALAVVTLAELPASLVLDTPQGAPLQRTALPYPIPPA
jgi:folate-binding protein YgfZ